MFGMTTGNIFRTINPSQSDDPLLPGLNHNYCFLFIINLF